MSWFQVATCWKVDLATWQVTSLVNNQLHSSEGSIDGEQDFYFRWRVDLNSTACTSTHELTICTAEGQPNPRTILDLTHDDRWHATVNTTIILRISFSERYANNTLDLQRRSTINKSRRLINAEQSSDSHATDHFNRLLPQITTNSQDPNEIFVTHAL